MKHTSRIIVAALGAFAFITMIGPKDAFACGCGDDRDDPGGGGHVAQHSGGGDLEQAQAVEADNGFAKKPAVGTQATCPVMGNTFTVTKDTKSSVYKGKHYVFCCPGCKPQFDKNPEKYTK